MGQRGEICGVILAVLLVLLVLAPAVGPPWPSAAAIRVLGAACLAVGLPILAWRALHLGRSLPPFPRPLPEGRLVPSGVFRFVRHPIYFGVLLCALGYALMTTSVLCLVLTIILSVFFDMKARREEVWLQARYPDYAAYRTRVKKLIPWIYRRRTLVLRASHASLTYTSRMSSRIFQCARHRRLRTGDTARRIQYPRRQPRLGMRLVDALRLHRSTRMH